MAQITQIESKYDYADFRMITPMTQPNQRNHFLKSA